MDNREEYLKKYRRCLFEYTNLADSVVNEVGEDPMAAGAAPADPMAAGAAPADPMAAGAAPADPMAAGAAPADPMAAGAAPMPGADPMAAGGAAPAEPAPVDPEAEAKQDNAPGGPITPQQNQEEGDEEKAEKDDELEDKEEDMEDAQKKAIEKIEKLASKFEKVFNEIDSIKQHINLSNEKIESLRADIEKRNPTPEEKLSLRSRNYSAPFSQPMDEYWDEKEEDSNYSTEDDENGEDMPEYKITKSDIDNINDWHSISKSFDDERFGLKGILGY